MGALASLTLAANTVTFPDSNPSTTPSVTASEGAINVTANVRTGAASTPTLTVISGGDLSTGSESIPVSNVTWTATGALVAGTMSKATAQSVGSWTGSGSRTGTMTFALANSWSYASGTYTATFTYTLTAP